MSLPRVRRADLGLLALAALLSGLFFADSLAAGATGAAGASSANGASSVDAPPMALDLTIGVLACLALLLRHRWPVLVAVVLIPSVVLSSAAMGATAVAMFTVARSRSWRVTVAVVGPHAAFVTVLFAAFTADGSTFWQGLAVVLALDAALVASGRLVRSNRLLIESLRDRAAQAEEGQRLRAEEVRHAERERIAREMHDVLAHRISLLAVHAGALEVSRSATEDERRAAGVVRQSAYGALEELREVIGMLRGSSGSADDRPQPTLADVPTLVEQSRLAGAEITLDGCLASPPETPEAPESLGRHAYRVVQEGLTNARKHAPEAPVRVAVSDAGSGLAVEIVNPLGSAAARIPGAGAGLIGLRERMDLVGGRLEHGETADGQFRLYAWLPWRP